VNVGWTIFFIHPDSKMIRTEKLKGVDSGSAGRTIGA